MSDRLDPIKLAALSRYELVKIIREQSKQLELAVKAMEEINNGKGEYSAVACRVIARTALSSIQSLSGGNETP